MENTNTTPSTARVALKAGLITALGTIIFSTVMNLMGVSANSPVQYLAVLVLLGGLIYGMHDFKEQNNGYMSYGQGLGIGTLISAVAGLISSIVNTLYIKLIDPTVMQRAMDEQRIQMENRGMTDAQIEQAIVMGEKVAPFAFLFATFFTVFVGFILSLIIAAIMKKDQDVLDV